jgi:hypothetical protein
MTGDVCFQWDRAISNHFHVSIRNPGLGLLFSAIFAKWLRVAY